MEVAIIILGLIVLALVVERHFYAKEMNRQLDEATKKVMSRNMNEYLASQAMDRIPKQTTIPENDEIELNQASDEVFDKAMKQMTK